MGRIPVDVQQHIHVGSLADPRVVGPKYELVDDSEVEGGEEIPPEHEGITRMADVPIGPAYIAPDVGVFPGDVEGLVHPGIA